MSNSFSVWWTEDPNWVKVLFPGNHVPLRYRVHRDIFGRAFIRPYGVKTYVNIMPLV